MTADAPRVVVRLRRPRLFEAPLLWRMLTAMVFLPVGLVAMIGPGGMRFVPFLLIGPSAVIALVLANRLVRRRLEPPPITVTPRDITLPASLEFGRTIHVPLDKLRSAAVLGRSGFARLVIDAGWRQVAVPVRFLTGEDAVERLHAALRDALGEERWAPLAARHAIAADLQRILPWGTWTFVGGLGLAYALQTAVTPASPLGLLSIGADAPILVWHGEWFRLVTANLLHASPTHLLSNAGALLIYGTFVERLAGFRRTLLVMLATGIVAHAVSAATSAELRLHLFSIGASGAAFGLMGALGAILWRFGKTIPGGLRPRGPAWWVLLAAYGAVVAILVPQIDSGAHAGGALAGLALGALVCGTCATTHALRRPGPWVTAATVGLGLVWVAAIAADVGHATSRTALLADQTELAAGLSGYPAEVENDVAWEIAINPDAGPALLRQAVVLADQAITASAPAGPADPARAAAIDTRATLDYRLGNLGHAVRLELPLISQGAALAAHLAIFLDRNLREHGPQILGDTGPPPTLSLGDGALHLVLANPAPRGARAYAVLRQHDVLSGMVLLLIPPGFRGEAILPLADASGVPDGGGVPGDGDAVEVALFDRQGCACTTPTVRSAFYPAAPGADLPPWLPPWPPLR